MEPQLASSERVVDAYINELQATLRRMRGMEPGSRSFAAELGMARQQLERLGEVHGRART